MRKVILTMKENEKYEIIKTLVDTDGNKQTAALKIGCKTGNQGGGGSYDPGSDYTVSDEALSAPAFAVLITEEEKYLGWPYVWGGSSPSTSFNCSGFVFIASGVHNLPRSTATGTFNQCAYVSLTDARPGSRFRYSGSAPTISIRCPMFPRSCLRW